MTPDFHTYGPAFAQVLVAMQYMTDDGHAACPQEWRELAGLLHTLIEDEGLSTEATAEDTGLPLGVVTEYRRCIGI